MNFFLITLALISFPWEMSFARTESRQVAKYKSVPVYQNKCTYDTYKWVQTSTRVHRGSLSRLKEQPMSWPKVDDLDDLTRANRQDPSYTLIFDYTLKDEPKTIQTTVDSETFSKWEAGDKANLRIRRRTGKLVDFTPVSP